MHSKARCSLIFYGLSQVYVNLHSDCKAGVLGEKICSFRGMWMCTVNLGFQENNVRFFWDISMCIVMVEFQEKNLFLRYRVSTCLFTFFMRKWTFWGLILGMYLLVNWIQYKTGFWVQFMNLLYKCLMSGIQLEFYVHSNRIILFILSSSTVALQSIYALYLLAFKNE